MRARIGIIASLCAMLSAVQAGARTWQEIRRGGTIVFAVSEQPTVYERSGRDVSGFHYLLSALLARQLSLKPQWTVVGPSDYGKTDIYGVPLLLRGADVLADHFPRTAEFRNAALFLPLYPSLKVCVQNARRAPVRTLSDLARWKAASLESDEVFFTALEKRIGRAVTRRSYVTAEEAVRAVVTGSSDYAILDSDLAFYFTRKNPLLSVQLDALKDVAALQDTGWFLDRGGTELKEKLTEALTTVRTNGDFAKIWNASFGQTFAQYREALKILEQKGEEIFRSSLDLAFNRKFEESVALFQTAKRMNMTSERLQRLYDTIHMDWAMALARAGRDAQMSVLDRYFSSEPSPGFADQLKKRDAGLYQDYLKKLRRDRDRMVREKSVTNAVAVQSVISMLAPDQASEKQIYDDIFLALLEEQEKKSGTSGLETLERYVQGRPTAYFFRRLRERLPALYDDYLHSLKGERDSAVKTRDLDRARRVQETIVTVTPDEQDEVNTLAVLGRVKEIPAPAEAPETELWAVRPGRDQDGAAVPQAETPESLRRTAASGESAVEQYEGERYFQLGLKAWEERNMRDALAAFQNARNLNYRAAECGEKIRAARAELRAEEDRENERKQREFNEAFSRGLSRYLREDYPGAQDEFLECLALFPDNAQARKFSAIVADNLRTEGERSVDVSSPYYPYYRNRSAAAEELFRRGDFAAARRIYEEILTLFPNHESARRRLIACLYRTDPEKLRVTLDDYFAEAKKLAAAGRNREAHGKFSFIRELDAKYPGIDGEWERTRPAPPAEAQNPAGTARRGTDVDGMLREAMALYERGLLEQSLQAYRKVLNAAPREYRALVNASRIENQLRVNRDRSPEELPSPVREKAENLYLKGQFYFRIQDYRKALELWEEAYRTDPTFRKAYIDIRRVRMVLGERRSAP